MSLYKYNTISFQIRLLAVVFQHSLFIFFLLFAATFTASTVGMDVTVQVPLLRFLVEMHHVLKQYVKPMNVVISSKN